MKLKQSLYFVLCMMILLAVLIPQRVFSEESAEEDQFTLKVGYWNGYGISRDANGRLYGYSYEYFKKIAAVNDWGIQFVSYSWPEGLKQLEAGNIDVFGAMQKMPEGEAVFDYPNYRMGYEYGALYVDDDNNSIFYGDPSTIDGKTVGSVKDNYYLNDLLEYCAKNGITVNIKWVNDPDVLRTTLENGTVDMILTGSLFNPVDTKVALRFENQEFYYPTTKGNSYVLNGLNHALSEISRENIYYDAELYDKYYKETRTSNKAFTHEEKEFINESGVITVGYDRSWPPIEYYDEKQGKAGGLSVDLLKKISDYSGLKFQLVETDGYRESLDKVKRNELDMVTSCTESTLVKKNYNLVLTKPLFKTALVFITKKETDMKNGGKLTCAIPKNWVYTGEFMNECYPKIKLQAYDNEDLCMNAVLRGTADLTIQNSYAAEAALKSVKYSPLAVMTLENGAQNYCIGVSAAAPPELVSILNKSIETISENSLNQSVVANTISMPYKLSLMEIVQANALLIIVLIAGFFMILYLFSWRSKQKLNKIAYYDSLTGEMNLSKFKIEAEKLLMEDRNGCAVIAIDINKFRSINDLYGYDFGDKILILVADKLRELVPEEWLFCRGVADKFYVLSSGAGMGAIEEMFRTFAKEVENINFDDKRTCKIVLCCGIYFVLGEDLNVTPMLDRANMACKSVKHSHNSSYAVYDQSMSDKINRAKEIENMMAASLKNNEFLVYLQPKFNLKTRTVAGAEALVRWKHPDKGFLLPGDFIPLFEENGFIVNIDFFVFEQVCKLLNSWKNHGRGLFAISVNLSRRHLENLKTAELLNEIASKYNVPRGFIELELTESAFVDCDAQQIKIFLSELHRYGFFVSVDDFGSGYSSLALLKDLPIDVLKIDKSFFNGNGTYKIRVILESVVNMSKKLNIKTVSEGIETEEQAELVRLIGCDMVQGFLFEKPMSIEALEAKYQQIY